MNGSASGRPAGLSKKELLPSAKGNPVREAFVPPNFPNQPDWGMDATAVLAQGLGPVSLGFSGGPETPVIEEQGQTNLAMGPMDAPPWGSSVAGAEPQSQKDPPRHPGLCRSPRKSPARDPRILLLLSTLSHKRRAPERGWGEMTNSWEAARLPVDLGLIMQQPLERQRAPRPREAWVRLLSCLGPASPPGAAPEGLQLWGRALPTAKAELGGGLL